VTLTFDGAYSGPDNPSGVFYNAGTATLNNCIFTLNNPGFDNPNGDILNEGTLTLNSTTVSEDNGFSPAFWVERGSATVNHSTLESNCWVSAVTSGSWDATLTVHNSIIDQITNNYSGTLSVNNSTINGINNGGTATVTNTTISAGSGIYNYYGTLDL